MCVLQTKICWLFHTVGNCKWCVAHETSSAMAYHSALPCCLPAVLSRLICSQHFHSGRSGCRSFRDESSWMLSTRCCITRKRIWKALQWRQSSSLAANTAGNFLCCLPTAHLLPSNQQSVSRWEVTEGLLGTHPWPLYERPTKRQESLLWLLRKGQELGGRQAPSIEHMSTLQI